MTTMCPALHSIQYCGYLAKLRCAHLVVAGAGWQCLWCAASMGPGLDTCSKISVTSASAEWLLSCSWAKNGLGATAFPRGGVALETGLSPSLHHLAQAVRWVNTGPLQDSCAAVLSCYWLWFSPQTSCFQTLHVDSENLSPFSFASSWYVELSFSSQSALWRQLFRVRLVRASKSWAGFLLDLFWFFFFDGCFPFCSLQVALCKVFLEKGSFTAHCLSSSSPLWGWTSSHYCRA